EASLRRTQLRAQTEEVFQRQAGAMRLSSAAPGSPYSREHGMKTAESYPVASNPAATEQKAVSPTSACTSGPRQTELQPLYTRKKKAHCRARNAHRPTGST